MSQMRFNIFALCALLGVIGASPAPSTTQSTDTRKTTISIRGDSFLINGQLTYAGRTYHGMRFDGLLFNSRMVQGIFDDRNPRTRAMWNYPDGPWDPQRNTREFVAAMPAWRAAGLHSFTINLQGGNPQGHGKDQPWINSAINPDGSLRPDYLGHHRALYSLSRYSGGGLGWNSSTAKQQAPPAIYPATL